MMGSVGGLAPREQASFNRSQAHDLAKKKHVQDRPRGSYFGGDQMPKWENNSGLDWWQNTTFTARNFPDLGRIVGDEEVSSDIEGGDFEPVILQHHINPYAQRTGRILKNGGLEYLEPPTLVNRLFGKKKICDGEESRPGSAELKEPDSITAEEEGRPKSEPPLGAVKSRNRGNPHQICQDPPFFLVMSKAARIWTVGVLVAMLVILVLELVAGGLSLAVKPPVFGPKDKGTLLAMGARWGPLIESGEFWRFGTCLFVHSGILQYVFSIVLHGLSWHFEGEWGFWKSLTVYLISGIYGSMLSSLVVPMAIVCGPSAAVFGWVGVELVDLMSDWRKAVRPVVNLVINLVIIVVGIVLGLFSFLDNWGHIGGLVFGMLISMVLLPNLSFGKCEWMLRGVVTILAFPILAVVFILTAIMFYKVIDIGGDICPGCYRLNCLLITGWCDK